LALAAFGVGEGAAYGMTVWGANTQPGPRAGHC
jgi:hypothetical protein